MNGWAAVCPICCAGVTGRGKRGRGGGSRRSEPNSSKRSVCAACSLRRRGGYQDKRSIELSGPGKRPSSDTPQSLLFQVVGCGGCCCRSACPCLPTKPTANKQLLPSCPSCWSACLRPLPRFSGNSCRHQRASCPTNTNLSPTDRDSPVYRRARTKQRKTACGGAKLSKLVLLFSLMARRLQSQLARLVSDWPVNPARRGRDFGEYLQGGYQQRFAKLPQVGGCCT